jgi:signal transduction histidine kinase
VSLLFLGLYIPQIMGIIIILVLMIMNRSANRQAATLIMPISLLAIWLLIQLAAQVLGSSEMGIILIRASIVTSGFMALSYFFAILNYSGISKRTFKDLLLIITMGIIAIVGMSDFSIISATADADGISIDDATYFYYVQLVSTIGLFGIALYKLYLYARSQPRSRRVREYILLLSTAQVVLLSGVGSVFFAHIAAAQVFIFISAFIFCAGIFFGIFKHRLFDIRFVVVRTIGYSLSIISLAILYFFVAYILSLTVFKGDLTSGISVSPINILLAIVLSFVFQPIKAFFDRATNNIFFRDRYKSDEFYARLSEVLTTTTDLRNLLQRAAQEIGTTLKAEQAFFFLQYDEGQRHITAGTKNHKDLPLDDVDSLNTYVRANGDTILVTQLLENDSKLKRVLVSHRIALLMPLMHHDKTVGYLALGEQKSSGYTNRDIKVLKTISDELIIAIQNALSVQEVRVINASLEQRIEMATAELRTSNARLKRLDASKDEFLSMASHQLRTPLTSVKGYLSMMIDGDVGKISAMQKQVLEEAFSSSERMVHLIHDFLNVSRLQTGKFMLELSDVDLAELIQQEVKSLEKVASSHSMKLEFTNTAGDVHLQIDDTKIRQVVMNYIDNAIYYSHPDSIIAIELSKTDKDVVLEIKDTGIGVPKSEQEQLFSKFYRASNARKQRPDGTGVGIFLAKKVVTALGGDIVFRSKEGKGSVFGFTLPLDQDLALLENNPKQLGK